MTMDRTFYGLLFKQEVVTDTSFCHIFFLIAFFEEAFIGNIIIILRTGRGKITSLNFEVNNKKKLFEIQKFYFWILKLQHGKF